SSIIATSCAIALSFTLNRNVVFADKDRPIKKLTRFILVSVVGVMLIQNLVYGLCLLMLQNHEAGIVNSVHVRFGFQSKNDFLVVNLSNLIASFAVMFWNYNGYRLFVF